MKKIAFAPKTTLSFYLGILDTKKLNKNKEQQRCAVRLNYYNYRNSLVAILKKKFKKEIIEIKGKILNNDNKLAHTANNTIWIYWAQGVKNAPDIVRVCVQSIIDQLGTGYKIVLLSDENLSEYISLPDFIMDKYKKGLISRSHYADIIRTKLLVEYGGTWIDSTILCSKKPPKEMLESELFFFQVGDFAVPTRIENWFITAYKNNKLLGFVLEFLYCYWKKYNFLVDYFLTYEIFEIAIEEFREEWDRVVYYPREEAFALSNEMGKECHEEVLKNILNRYSFHKLTYKCQNYGWPTGAGSSFDWIVKNYKKYRED
jgi:hypothetical protein